MMKLYLTFLVTLSYSFIIGAQEIQKNPTYFYTIEDANKRFATKYTLSSSYEANFNPKEQTKEFNQLMKNVSEEMQERFSNTVGGHLVKPRSCEILCIEYGTGAVRKTISTHTKGAVSVSEDSKRCAKACGVYFGEYNGYIAGREDEKEAMAKSANINCSGAINSDKREAKPKSYEMYIDKESGKTKQK